MVTVTAGFLALVMPWAIGALIEINLFIAGFSMISVGSSVRRLATVAV